MAAATALEEDGSAIDGSFMARRRGLCNGNPWRNSWILGGFNQSENDNRPWVANSPATLLTPGYVVTLMQTRIVSWNHRWRTGWQRRALMLVTLAISFFALTITPGHAQIFVRIVREYLTK